MTFRTPFQIIVATGAAVLLLMSATGPARAEAPVATGDPINVETATRVAQQHLRRLNLPDTLTFPEIRAIPAAGGTSVLCYCFDLRPEGYIIVSGAPDLPPVIAYSFTSDAGCDLTAGNPLADLLRWDLQARLNYAAWQPAEAAAQHRIAWAEYLDAAPALSRNHLLQQWPPAGSTPTGGWLLSNWHQGAPYNNLCPMDNVAHARSQAGCPAVAMAQILNFHARLNGTRFSDSDDYYHNYGGNQFWIDDGSAWRDFPSWPQLNTHLQALFGHYFYGTTPTDTCKAGLVYACGAAAHQVYGASASGTFAVAQAFHAYQKFGCASAALLDTSDSKLYQRLAENMMAGAPAHLAIVDPNWSTGHNLVVDGYNTSGFFHLNFGWNGSYNGWYLLPSGLPFNLTVVEGVILDIMTDACMPMDCTCDGLISWEDFTYFATCLAGPATGGYAAPGCTAFDIDTDADIDLADARAFQLAFSASAP